MFRNSAFDSIVGRHFFVVCKKRKRNNDKKKNIRIEYSVFDSSAEKFISFQWFENVKLCQQHIQDLCASEDFNSHQSTQSLFLTLSFSLSLFMFIRDIHDILLYFLHFFSLLSFGRNSIIIIVVREKYVFFFAWIAFISTRVLRRCRLPVVQGDRDHLKYFQTSLFHTDSHYSITSFLFAYALTQAIEKLESCISINPLIEARGNGWSLPHIYE